MNEAISEALRWLAAARELLEVEPFTDDFRRLLMKHAVERAVTALNRSPHGFDE
jgi:hypothetical protein